MKIKNIDIEFNFLDADNVEKFENEAKKVVEKTSKDNIKELSYAEALRFECNIVEEFIDNVFGVGISEKVFEGKKDLMEHLKVFQDIVDEKNSKQQELQNLYNRYAPNRTQRRKSKKNV